jgi:arylsulfatase
VSNEIVHIMDIFTTMAKFAGAPVPTDRPIDGVDQTEFLLGKQTKSNREGVLIYVDGDLQAVKWRDWKLHFWWQLEPQSGKDSLGAIKLEVPYLFNLLMDPQEETDVRTANTWVLVPISRMISDFQRSLKKFPSIPPGTPDPYEPPKT